MKFLVTGCAGFIGMSISIKLLNEGHTVVGIDNLNDYYDVHLKEYRLKKLENYPKYKFILVDLSNRVKIQEIFENENFQRVIHLGAQAGVRYSIESPYEYIDSNLVGTSTVLEGCRNTGVEHLVFASSSSVYGMNKKVPFSTSDSVDHPVSLYAATKKANELMAHSYSHLYNIPTTGLRFFTVYGPAGRPDMAPWLFTEAILSDKPIKVFNHGKMMRDFTYIDDIVDGIYRVQSKIPSKKESNVAKDLDPSFSFAPYKIYNIGNNKPVELSVFIDAIEQACGKKSKKIYLEMQPGDVKVTYADIESISIDVGFRPSVGIYEGIERFVDWYKKMYKL